MRQSTFSMTPSLVALFALLALLALTHTSTAQTDVDLLNACSDHWEENVNYFTTNAIPIDSSGYTLTYHNYYKLLTNTITNETYCLYCGSVIPNGTVPSSTIKAYIQIPVKKISLQDIPSLDFLELLGSLNLVVAVSLLNNVTSPCALAAISSNTIVAFNESESYFESSSITFTSVPVNNLETHTATVSLPESLTPLAKANWIHFFAAFTNQESKSIAIFDSIKNEYNCHRENLKNITDRFEIAWTSYDPIAKAWDLRNDTFRTSLISDAGGTFPVTNQTHFTSNGTFENAIARSRIVIDETPFGSTGNTFTDWLALSGFLPGTTASNATFITARNVFRTDKSQNRNGYSSWLERSPSRPDLILRDLISAQYPTYDKTYQMSFLENWSKGDTPNYYEPGACNNTYYPPQPQSIGNCNGSSYTLPVSTIAEKPVDVPKTKAERRTLSTNEKLGIAFGITGGAILVAAVSIVTVRFLKRRKIGFGEETTGFMRISDLD